MNITPAKLLVVIVLLFGLILLKDDSVPLETATIPTQQPILAFGDSLTYGKGALREESYPSQLQQLLGTRVINGGISGEKSATGLSRLPQLLQKHQPALVILCHGGNDLIQKKSKEQLKSNLKKMIQLIKLQGSQVLLVGVPNFKMLHFSTEDLYEEVAEEMQVMYEGEVLSQIENESNLKSDRVHPNAKGYSLMAEHFARKLKEYGVVK